MKLDYKQLKQIQEEYEKKERNYQQFLLDIEAEMYEHEDAGDRL